MVKRTSFEGDACPIARSLEAIGDWWSLLIIRDALLGVRRFGEFQSKLGMAKNILAVRLRSLVEHGILATAPASDGSAYQEYVLTPKGRGTFPILVALRQWSEAFDDRPEEIATILVDRDKGRPVRKLELRAADGRLLSQADTTLKPRPAQRRRRSAGRTSRDLSRELRRHPEVLGLQRRASLEGRRRLHPGRSSFEALRRDASASLATLAPQDDGTDSRRAFTTACACVRSRKCSSASSCVMPRR